MRRLWQLVSAVAVAIAVASIASPVGAAPTTACTTGASGTLVPVLQDFSVNQGLESYTSGLTGFTGRLARGKETLVRAYLTLPSGCSGSITVTGASLTFSDGSTQDVLSPYAGTASGGLSSTLQAASTADPLFVVPVSDLAPSDGSSTFTATFSLSVTFTQNKSSTPITRVYGAAPIAPVTFEKKTNALRILVVPMGDASQSFSSQFPAAATSDVQNAMSTLSRIYPVSGGVGDLAGTSGGIRYTIDTATMLDLKSVAGAYDGNGRFCGGQTNFDAIKGLLAQYLQSWNTANPNAVADRVVGAVYGGNGSTTLGISDGASFGCSEGMAAINGSVAWVRAIDDNPTARTPTTSWTGGVLAMELEHTFGGIPAPRSLNYHSPNIQADVVSPTGRAYNVTSRSYVASNHSVMKYDTSTSPYDNNDTLLEQQDYNDMLCWLTPGALTNPECATSGVVGTLTGVSAGPRLVVSGTISADGTSAYVVESYYSTSVGPSGICPSSPYRLQQLNGGSVLNDVGICVETISSDHEDPDGTANTTSGVFSVAADGFEGAGADTIRIVNGATVLYSRDKQTTSPTVTSVSASEQDFGPLTLKAPVIPPTPDVLILADTTGSMGPALQSVKDDLTQSGGIIPTIRAMRSNAAFGAAQYRDIQCDRTTGYHLDQAITTDTSVVNSAVGTWSTAAGVGCDGPEDQLYALWYFASNPDTVGWRSGSTRIIVWFGDAPGHDPSPLPTDGYTSVSLADTTRALENANIHVVAVPVSGGDGGLDQTGQATAITQATGGRLQPLTSPADVASAITAGLQNLPVMLDPTTSCGDTDITLTLGDQTPPNPVDSGAAVRFSDVVAHIPAGTSPGDYTCNVYFDVNGTRDDSLTRTYRVHVAPASSYVTVTATSSTPDDLRVDVYYVCGDDGLSYPVAVGLPPASVSGTEASFSTRFDSTLACGGSSSGNLVAYASDGFDRSAAQSTDPSGGAPPAKPPTAAIYVPVAGTYAAGSTVAYSGTGLSPQTGELDASHLAWSLSGPGGSVGASGKTGTIQLPSAPGTYTLTLTVTDAVGSGTDTKTLTVVAPPTITIARAAGGATATSVQLEVTAADPNGLDTVSCSVDGAPADVAAAGGAPSYNATLTLSGTGLHSATCRATGTDGLYTDASYQQQIYTFNGFLSPVGNGVTNTGKGGRTYPVKWQLKDFTGAFVSSLSAVKAVQLQSLSCGTLTAATDPLEISTTGSTSLRYDSTANQYVYNWQTPGAGCFELDVVLDDGTVHPALFMLS